MNAHAQDRDPVPSEENGIACKREARSGRGQRKNRHVAWCVRGVSLYGLVVEREKETRRGNEKRGNLSRGNS